MITPDYVRLMARYNSWQNGSLYAAADALSDAARREVRGAFFGSIHGTLSHILWGDRMIGFGRYRYRQKSGQPGQWPLTAFAPGKARSFPYSSWRMTNSLFTQLGAMIL